MYPGHELSLFFFSFSSRVLTLLLALGGMKIFLSDILILTLGSKPYHFFCFVLLINQWGKYFDLDLFLNTQKLFNFLFLTFKKCHFLKKSRHYCYFYLCQYNFS